jgi:hypothetical protein
MLHYGFIVNPNNIDEFQTSKICIYNCAMQSKLFLHVQCPGILNWKLFMCITRFLITLNDWFIPLHTTGAFFLPLSILEACAGNFAFLYRKYFSDSLKLVCI